jgi:hypothetical protein
MPELADRMQISIAMRHYSNDRLQMQLTFSSLTIAAVIISILSVVVVMRTSACTVPDTSSHHQLLR